MAVDPWATEKKDLRSKDAKTFIYTANHLLLQRIPALTELVRGSEKRLLGVAFDRKAKPGVRVDALRALATLEVDPSALEPLLATEKSVALLQAIAIAMVGPDGRVASEPAVTALIARYEKPGDWSPQYDAIVALRYFGDDRIDAVFRAALGHAQGAVQREAIAGLGHQRNRHTILEIAAFLTSKNPQHVAAAARALSAIGLPIDKLADKKIYAHALKLAKDPIQARFGVRALAYFNLPTVEDDLVKLVKSDDGEVREGACDGLLHRRAVNALIPIATHIFSTSKDPSYDARFLVVLLNGLAAVVAKPPPAVVAGLAAVLAKVKPAVYQEIIDDTEQLRYRIDRLDADSQRRVATWREAIGKKLRDKTVHGLAAQLMTSPS